MSQGGRDTIRDKIRKNPKVYLWLSGLHVTVMSVMRHDNTLLGTRVNLAQRELLELETARLRKALPAWEAVSSRLLPPSFSGAELYRKAVENSGESTSEQPEGAR